MMRLKRGNISVKHSPIHGFGVFADGDISAGELIEQCYVLVFAEDSKKLRDYAFDVTKLGHENESGIPLGYGAIYNHADVPNADYNFDEEHSLLCFLAILPIKRGEEITVSYGNDWFSSRSVQPVQTCTWFHIKRFFRTHRRLIRMLLVVTSLVLVTQLLRDLPIIWPYNLL